VFCALFLLYGGGGAERGDWKLGAESVVEAFEILGLQLALLDVHSAAKDGTQVLVMMNQHGT
jgi:hypothetical protein